jgi:hypothetical protein
MEISAGKAELAMTPSKKAASSGEEDELAPPSSLDETVISLGHVTSGEVVSVE